MRHLVTRVERPASSRRAGAKGDGEARKRTIDEVDVYSTAVRRDEEEDEAVEVIDESESEAAPRATD